MKYLKVLIMSALGAGMLLLSGCGEEGCKDVNALNFDPNATKDCGCCQYASATINGNFAGYASTGYADGDFVGNGGSATRSFTWHNYLNTAEYNMDITSTLGGSAQMIIQDANGAEVVNYSLIKGQTPDSKSGVSSAGTPGTWTITIIVKNFNGDGSYSVSRGD